MQERKKQILTYLKKHERGTVCELAARFFVSEMTIRRDLKELEQSGYVERYHGGAVIRSDAAMPIRTRKYTHQKQKEQIIEAARKYLHDGMHIFLDSSSTCLYLIPLLAEYRELVLLTNSVQSLLLAARYHIPCRIAGGSYYERDMCTVGSAAEAFFRDYRADIAFLSVAGISDEGLISDYDEPQTRVRREMMKHARRCVFFFDRKKLHKEFPYPLAHAEEAEEVVIF